jgi:hypothetical protein
MGTGWKACATEEEEPKRSLDENWRSQAGAWERGETDQSHVALEGGGATLSRPAG